MKLSYLWLKQLLPDLTASAEDVAQRLTMLGLEVDSRQAVASDFTGVVVGEIIAIKAHPDANRLQLCSVNVGDDEPLRIVCGAANARLHLKVACALVGAQLSADFKIKKTKIRGEESFGMLCSAAELGMEEASNGILELDKKSKCGSCLREYLQLNDEVLEVDLTPNRGDCASVLGVARECAAYYQITLNHPHEENTLKPTLVDEQMVSVKQPQQAPLFLTQVVRSQNFSNPLPVLWSERLRRSGLRSVHPVVDILNLVMLELGTPMHAYDKALLKGLLEIDFAKEGKEVTLLDGKTYKLSATDLQVSDEQQVLALAGVMGAMPVAVSDATTEIVLEAAYFSPMTVARTARAQGLSSDSQYRFERGVDDARQKNALALAVHMLGQYADIEYGPVHVSCSKNDMRQRSPIRLRRSQIKRLLGLQLEDHWVENTLTQLGFKVARIDEGWESIAPSWRFDVAIEEDLLEELLRFHGYDRLPRVDLSWPQVIHAPDLDALAQRRCRQLLVDLGYYEMRSYSFISEKLSVLFNPQHEAKKLANPLAKDQAVMRMSLWPGLLQAVQTNLHRQHKRMRFFELGACFKASADGDYLQSNHLAAVMVGSQLPQQWSAADTMVDFYDLKGDLEQLQCMYSLVSANAELTDRFSFCRADLSAASHPALHPALHPGQSACIKLGSKEVGYIGKLHPQILAQLKIKTNFSDIYLFEINLDELTLPSYATYQPASCYPAMRRDLAFVMPLTLEASTLIAAMDAFAASLLGDIHFTVNIFDLYQGEGIAADEKSLALGLTFQSSSRTLIDEEINIFIQRLVDHLQTSLRVNLRG